MRHGCSELDVTHTLATNLLSGYLDTALLTDLALEADSLILTAKTFPVLRRAKDALAEETVALGFESTVVYSLGLGDLTVRPRTDHLGRGKTDLYRIKRIIIHTLTVYLSVQFGEDAMHSPHPSR